LLKSFNFCFSHPQQGEISVISAEVEDVNPKMVSNFSIDIFNGSDQTTRYSLGFTLKQDLNQILMSGGLSSKQKRGEEFSEMLKGNLEFCDLRKSLYGQMMIPLVEDAIRQDSNIRMECPMTKGHYYVRNAAFPDSSVFSRSPLKVDGTFRIFWIASTKSIKGNRIRLYKIKVDFRVKF
jgi:Protein of unknown function (DUF1091)